MTTNMKPFCSICIRYIGTDELASRGVVREPLGKDGAMVVVCERCAKNSPSITRRPLRPPPTAISRALRLHNHRESLAVRGLCINGTNHARPEEGFRMCNACREKKYARKRRAA